MSFSYKRTPRLLAVNVGGDPTMASLVCDLSKDCTIAKVAPLQSALRAATQMIGCVNSGPFLAWELGLSGGGARGRGGSGS